MDKIKDQGHCLEMRQGISHGTTTRHSDKAQAIAVTANVVTALSLNDNVNDNDIVSGITIL